jgi:hypothetical protein
MFNNLGIVVLWKKQISLKGNPHMKKNKIEIN